MAAMKDITNYSSSSEESRNARASDDNIFVSFSTPPSRTAGSERATRTHSSPSRSILRILNEVSSSDEEGRTSRILFTEDFAPLPSVLLTPTTPNEPDKTPKFSHFSREPCTRPRKKPRLEHDARSTSIPQTPLEVTLQGLTKPQLVELVNSLVSKRHPELTEELQQLIPEPDLKEMEEKLKSLKRNIYKAFPHRTRSVCSSRDAFSFRRVHTQIQAFKKECISQGNNLVSSYFWTSAIEYVLMAWQYVDNMPTWESPAHNSSKIRCFKTLAVQCKKALNSGTFNLDELNKYENRLEDACTVNKNLLPCLEQVKHILSQQQMTPMC